MSFAHRTANPDQDDLSHRAVWPWGRGNHYLFDMNRDWFTMIQPESARSREIAAWLPQLLVDSHEMGANATYLFPPPRHPFNPHPAGQRAASGSGPSPTTRPRPWTGAAIPTSPASGTRSSSPATGRPGPSYHGGVGILYEMSRTTGTLVRKRGGTVRTFAQAVEHQTTSSLANLDHPGRRRGRDPGRPGRRPRRRRSRTGPQGKVRAWVFPADPRQSRNGSRSSPPC